MSQLFTGAEFIFALVLMLGVVITVHEFGHFIVAKWCGVRILKFSVGFGSAIGIGPYRLKTTRNGTEYAISWIPLGGYVRMLGESPQEAEEAPPGPGVPFSEKPLWQKLLILVAGPAMNLVLPVVLFAVAYAVGLNREDAIIGSVERGSPAEAAGLLPGDRVTQVGGQPILWWSEVSDAVRGNPGDSIQLQVARGAHEIPLEIEIGTRRGVDTFRSPTDVGWVGLQHTRLKPVLGIPASDSEAARLGFRSGDRVVSVAGDPVTDWGEFTMRLAAEEDGLVPVTIERGPVESASEELLSIPAGTPLDTLGMIPAVVLVAWVEPGSAAGEAGVEIGDLIVGIDGNPVGSFFTFQETVLGSEGRELALAIARDGESLTIPVAPRLLETDVGGTPQELYRIGIQGENAILAGSYALDRELNPLMGLIRGTEKTAEITVLFARGLKKLLMGEISRKSIGGPIEIARQSHQALRSGWDRFMEMLILISINIGILNLLPIPVLDGGQALMYSIEGLKRGPLSLRTREFVQQVGVVMLLTIMGFAFWNDISRNWSTFFGWVTGS